MIEPRRLPYRNLLAAGVALALAVLVTAGFKSWSDLEATRARERDLRARISAAQERIESLVDHVERLDQDPLALEREARAQLGFVRPGDVIVVLPSEPSPVADPMSPPAGRAGS